MSIQQFSERLKDIPKKIAFATGYNSREEELKAKDKEITKLKDEIKYIDEILSKRDALDKIPNRIDKILFMLTQLSATFNFEDMLKCHTCNVPFTKIDKYTYKGNCTHTVNLRLSVG